MNLDNNQKPFHPMNKLPILAALLLPALLSAAPLSMQSPFTPGSAEQLQRLAAQTGRPYLLYFTTAEVAICDWMEENTFADPALTEYLAEFYFAGRIDVQTEEGGQLQHRYEVNQLPSVLVFNAGGHLLGRQTGLMAAAALQDFLKGYDHSSEGLRGGQARFASAPSPAAAAILPSPKAIVPTYRARLVPDRASSATPAPARQQPSPAAQAAAPAQKATVNPQANYTVQVGLYTSYANALAAKQQLEASSDCPGNVQEVALNGRKVFRLCSGAFPDVERARTHQQALQGLGQEGFVRRL